jgi:hypothetical protein
MRVLYGCPLLYGRGSVGGWVRTALLCLVAGVLDGQALSSDKQRQIASFEKVWTTIRDKHWQKNPAGLDWQAIHADAFRHLPGRGL